MEQQTGAPIGLPGELLASVVNAAPDGILVVDAEGVIQLANPRAEQLFGYDEGQLGGLPVDLLLPERLRDIHAVHRAAYVAHPRTRAMGTGLDLRARRKSGEEIPVEIALSPVGDGAQTHVIAIVRDLTERHAAAEELMIAHEQLALVDDRERIARDLHDTVIQRLFAVGLSLQAAQSRTEDPDLGNRITTAIDEIDATIRDIRTAIFSLHSRRATATALRDEVLSTAREAGRALGFDPHVEFDGPVDAATDAHIREQLVPTLREALSNVVKHAGAQRVSVAVRVLPHEIVLEVVDDGVGPDAGSSSAGGRGIGNMNERATAVGGRCDICANEPGGTRVVWRAPRA